MVDWCVSRLVRLICWRIILTARIPGRLLICRSLVISLSLTTFTFRSSEVRRLLLDLDPYGGTDPLGMFPLFLKRTADVMATQLCEVFRRLVRLGSFPACWRQANFTPIPEGPSSSSVANYRTIFITSVLSKVLSAWCRFVLDDLWNAVVCFQPPSWLIGKIWVPVMHLCACPIYCRVHWRVAGG